MSSRSAWAVEQEFVERERERGERKKGEYGGEKMTETDKSLNQSL